MTEKKSKPGIRIIKWLVIFLVTAPILFSIGFKVISKSTPVGEPGPAADALARKMMAAVNHNGWERTGAVSWNFGNRQEHLWDRTRHLARVRWSGHEVLINLHNRTGKVVANGKVLSEKKSRDLLDKAWSHWANDSFWLNPISKVFDPGVERALVTTETGPALKITFTEGGDTPGDVYLWHLDEQGLPVKWQMWVSIIPVGGASATWENWVTLKTGYKASTLHKLPVFTLELLDIKGAETLQELVPGPDPFAEIWSETPEPEQE